VCISTPDPLYQDLESSVRRGEESREDKSRGTTADEDFVGSIPPALGTPAFVAAWRSFAKHRREKKARLTPTAAEKQLAACLGMGEARAIAAIDLSVRQGWTGIFEDKNAKTAVVMAPAKEREWS
jgi:hypothetical protein